MKLEQKMEEMEKTMKELEQRYCAQFFFFLVTVIFILINIVLCCFHHLDYRAQSNTANKVTSRTKI